MEKQLFEATINYITVEELLKAYEQSPQLIDECDLIVENHHIFYNV